MKTLKLQKVRYGWELVLDAKVVAKRTSNNAKGEILLIAMGVIAGLESTDSPFKVEDHLAFILREKGFWQQKSPLQT